MKEFLISHTGIEILTYIAGGFLAVIASFFGSAVSFCRRLGRKIDGIAAVGNRNSDQIHEVSKSVDLVRGELQRVIQEVGPLKERVAVLEFAVENGLHGPKRKGNK